MDDLLAPLLDDLRVQLAAALRDSMGGEAGCAVVLQTGTEAVADWCTCGSGRDASSGMGWVRLSDVYPDPPPRAPGTVSGAVAPHGCATTLNAVIEVGVYRHAPTPSERGTPPSPADQVQAALVVADDSMAIYRALTCSPRMAELHYQVGRWRPLSGGDCTGGAWTTTVRLQRLPEPTAPRSAQARRG